MAADVGLTEDGDLPRNPELITGFEAAIQKVAARLRLHRGEWRADTDKGFPWIEWFRSTPLPLEEIVSIVPSHLEEIAGVGEVQNFTGDFDRDSGVVTLSGDIRGESDGNEATIELTYDRTGPNVRSSVAIKRLVLDGI
jgi:hypothetical protein